jgi:hypothetical protein
MSDSESRWDDVAWDQLILAIRRKRCTPFLGAGASAGSIPLGREIAERWAGRFNYPFPDRENLVRVAQYLSVQNAFFPKLLLSQEAETFRRPNFEDPSEPHRLVADMDLPLYITTNYDDFLEKAMHVSASHLQRVPHREICKWHESRKRHSGPLYDSFDPTPERPLIFHLHGVFGNEASMVLTEDDYLDFLICISEVPELIPPRVEEAFASTTLLFLGYSLEDLNFRVLFRKLATYLRRAEGTRHVSVQLAPNPGSEGDAERADRQRQFLRDQLQFQRVKVYWGTCAQFAADLRSRL